MLPHVVRYNAATEPELYGDARRRIGRAAGRAPAGGPAGRRPGRAPCRVRRAAGRPRRAGGRRHAPVDGGVQPTPGRPAGPARAVCSRALTEIRGVSVTATETPAEREGGGSFGCCHRTPRARGAGRYRGGRERTAGLADVPWRFRVRRARREPAAGDALEPRWVHRDRRRASRDRPRSPATRSTSARLDGKLYALDLATGTPRWHVRGRRRDQVVPGRGRRHGVLRRREGRVPRGRRANGQAHVALRGRRPRSSRRRTSPAIASSSARTISSLYCLAAASGKLLWKIETEGYVYGTPAIDGDRVILTGCDGFVRILRLTDGVEIRRIEIGAYVGASPAIAADARVLRHVREPGAGGRPRPWHDRLALRAPGAQVPVPVLGCARSATG